MEPNCQMFRETNLCSNIPYRNSVFFEALFLTNNFYQKQSIDAYINTSNDRFSNAQIKFQTITITITFYKKLQESENEDIQEY